MTKRRDPYDVSASWRAVAEELERRGYYLTASVLHGLPPKEGARILERAAAAAIRKAAKTSG